jgi:hypothetical protein
MRSILGLIVAAPIIASFTGCAATHQVRYVYQDGEFGVVGMPENTDRWPTRYRHQAENLMVAHFPEGHEIVRAEEVVKGSRTLTVQGTNSAELTPHLPAATLIVGKLGRSATRSQADNVKIEECRIVYRKASRPGSPSTYAPLATLTPTKYVNPNDSEHQSVSKHAADDDCVDEPKQEAKSEKKKADTELD